MKLTRYQHIKIGIFIVGGLSILIMGLYFFRGANFFSTQTILHAQFKNVTGVAVASPIYANGLVIGTVYDMEASSQNISDIDVILHVNKRVHLPLNSIIYIKEAIIGENKLEIKVGDDGGHYLESGDTIRTASSVNFSSAFSPMASKLDHTLGSVIELTENVNALVEKENKSSLNKIIKNVELMSEDLKQTSTLFKKMLIDNQQSINQTLNNAHQFTVMLNKNQGKIDAVVDRLYGLSQVVDTAQLRKSFQYLNQSLMQMSGLLTGIHNNKSLLNALIFDTLLNRRVHQNLYSLNILLDDIRAHPERYATVNVFGNKKQKNQSLKKPLYDSAFSQ